MAKQTINIGTTANDGTGDPIRAAFGKVNDNFTEIYTANTGVNTGDQNLSAYATTAAVAAGYQPLDSDLTAISALTTTAYGRALLSTADAATLRSAIGVGQTDAPTFLAQTLTGQSLTVSQSTNLLNLATTWDTTGNPSLIYGRVTNNNSGPTSNLIDLGTFAGGSLFKVNKEGLLALPASGGNGGGALFGGSVFPTGAVYTGQYGVRLASDVAFSWSSGTNLNTLDLNLFRDGAPGILAQRNGVNAQAFRVYNTTDAGNINYERGYIQWSSGTLLFGYEAGGTGSTGRIVVLRGSSSGGVRIDNGANLGFEVRGGNFLALIDNAYDIGASGGNRPKDIWARGTVTSGNLDATYDLLTSVLILKTGSASNTGRFVAQSNGVVTISNQNATDFGRLQLGGTTDAFPAIARDGAGIKFTGAASGSTSWIKVPAVAVASLPAAATAGVGARSFVNDALAPTFGSAVTGGGAVTVPVYSTGSAWNVG